MIGGGSCRLRAAFCTWSFFFFYVLDRVNTDLTPELLPLLCDFFVTQKMYMVGC